MVAGAGNEGDVRQRCSELHGAHDHVIHALANAVDTQSLGLSEAPSPHVSGLVNGKRRIERHGVCGKEGDGHSGWKLHLHGRRDGRAVCETVSALATVTDAPGPHLPVGQERVLSGVGRADLGDGTGKGNGRG